VNDIEVMNLPVNSRGPEVMGVTYSVNVYVY
jgi:hypothetical protein